MPVEQGTNTGLPQEPPKPRKPQPYEPEPAPSDYLNQGAQDQRYKNISVVENAAKGTLSSDTILYLAGLSDDEKELARLGRVFAKRFETPPQFFYGEQNLKDQISPVTGEPMTARELRRFTQDFEPVALAAMLSQELGVTPEEFARIVREKGGTVRTNADVERLVKATGSLSRVLAREYGDELTAPEALALAVSLAKKGVKPQVLTSNLQYLRAYMATGQGDVDPAQVRNWAIASAVNGQRFRSIRDVQAAVFGKDAVRQRERIASDIAAYEQETGREYRDLNPEETDIVQRMEVEGGGVQAALDSPSFKLSPDFWGEVERIQADVKMDEYAYQNSLVGKVMDPVTRAFNQTWEWTQQGLMQGGAAIVSVATEGIGETSEALNIVPEGTTERAQEQLFRSKSYAWERLKEGDTVGTFVAEGYGLPSWAAPAFDLFVGWYVDPFVLGGKFAQWRRAGRLLPGMTRAELTGNALLDVPGVGRLVKGRRAELAAQEYGRFTKYVNEVLPKSWLSKRLFKAMNEGNRAYFRELDKIYGIFQSRGVFDYEYMKLLRDRLILRYGKNGVIPAERMDEARRAWEEGLKAHYLGFGPEGSVASEVVTMRILQARNADQGVLGALPTTEVAVHNGQEFQQALGSELLVPRSSAADVAESVIRENVQRIPFSPEAPAGGLLSTIGPRRATRALMYSERLTESRLGRRVSRLPSLNPGRVMNIEEASDEYTLLHARRWAQFSDDEVRIYQSRMVEIENKGGGVFSVNGKERFLGREAAKEALIDEINRAAIGRVAARYGLTEETIEKLTDGILAPYRRINSQRTFGVLDDKRITVGGESRPLLESQLQNQLIVVDPVEAIRDIRQYVGVRRRFRADLVKALGKEAPEITGPIADALSRLSIGSWEFALDLGRGYQRLWKALTVARPGYIPRVILGDENLRFLATTESIAERLLSQRLTVARHGVGNWLDDSRLLSRTLPDGQKVGLFDDVIEIGGEYVVIPRPGSWRYDYEPMAANRTRQVEMLEEILTDANTAHRARKNGTVAWDILRPVEAGEDAYVKAWQWVLEKQFRNSAPGRVALESIVGGDSVVTTKRKLLQWAKDDDYVTLRTRMGIEVENIDDWADQVARLSHAYTLSDTRIAALALNGDDVQGALRSFFGHYKGQNALDELPSIHGPTIADNMPTAEAGAVQQVTDAMYTAFVRLPEDVLNRQPFYRTWKRRAERGYYRLLEQEGLSLTPEVRRAIDVASRNFALDTVKKIMFDFTRQSRFTEVLQLFFPFPQPFFEGFQAWGHIVWRNPEAVGRARAIYQLGVDSGFLEEDPKTGEIVVPMGAWWSLARKMSLFNQGIDQDALDEMGLTFVAPLSSFNMLSMSSMRIPSGGFIGKVAGGMPLPLPGMNPPIQWVLQRGFAGTNNDALQSWLYQYGPSTALMPSQITRVLRFIAPEQFDDDRVASYSLAIQERWQQLGLDKNPDGSLIPVDQIAAESRELAQELVALHGFVSMFSPGSLRIQWGTEELRKEWFDLRDSYGDDYAAARDAWDQRHPDLPLIPISNTYYTDPLVWEKYGKLQQAGYEGAPAPRVPASPFTQEMLNTPGIGDFMRNNPAWAALVLVGIDAEYLESQDFSAFSNQLAVHLTAYKDPLTFARNGRDALAWREIDKFYSSYWTPQSDKLDRMGADTQDDYYQGMIQARQEAFLGVATAFPDFAERYFEAVVDPETDEVIGYDWADGSQGKPMDLIVADARSIVNAPGFESFPGFQALGKYLELRDGLAEDMAADGIRYLDDMDGKKYWNRYEKGVLGIMDETPGMDQFFSSYFGIRIEDGQLLETDDLMGGLAADRILSRRKYDEETLGRIDRFDLSLEGLKDRAYDVKGAELAYERSSLYQRAQEYMDTAPPKLVRQWWSVQSKSYQKEYVAGLASKPPVFYSRFDWELISKNTGNPAIKPTAKATRYLTALSQDRVEIAQAEQQAAGSFSESAAYEDIDRWVRERIDPKNKKLYDASFAAIVRAQNRWSFPLEAAGYVKYDEETKTYKPGPNTVGKAGAGWVDLAVTLMQTQDYADAREMLGVNYGDEADRDAYSQGQIALANWVEDHRANKAWARQWDRMKEESADVLIGNVFMPDNYFGGLGEVG